MLRGPALAEELVLYEVSDGVATVTLNEFPPPTRSECGSSNRHQARARGDPQAPPVHGRARGPARIDGGVGEEGALAPPQRVGGDDLAERGDAASRRARIPRPLLPRGVRRAGRRLLLLARPRRVHELLRIRRNQHGLRSPDGHGPTPRPPARNRGTEAALPGPG